MTLIWVDTPIPQELLLPNHVSVPDVFPNLQDAYPQRLTLTCLVSHSQHMFRWSRVIASSFWPLKRSTYIWRKRDVVVEESQNMFDPKWNPISKVFFTDCFPLSRKSQARSTQQASHGWDEPRTINDSWDEFFGKFCFSIWGPVHV